MIRLLPYEDKYDGDVKALSAREFTELQGRKQYFPESFFAALDENDVFSGFCYLYPDATFLQVEKRELPYYYIHGVFLAVPGSPEEVECTALLLERLQECYEDIREDYPRKRIILRTWCRAGALAKLEFLTGFGFRAMNVTQVMEKVLSEEFTDSDPAPVEMSLKKELAPEEIPDYLSANENAFSVPDSMEELKLKLSGPGGGIALAKKEGKIIASVTVWEEDNETASTENIFCVDRYRNRGITTALILFTHRYLFAAGYKKARLTVFGDNLPAMNLYLKLGYEITDVILEMHYEPDYRHKDF